MNPFAWPVNLFMPVRAEGAPPPLPSGLDSLTSIPGIFVPPYHMSVDRSSGTIGEVAANQRLADRASICSGHHQVNYAARGAMSNCHGQIIALIADFQSKIPNQKGK